MGTNIENLNKTCGQRLKECRKEKKYTQKQLAKHISVSVQQISYIENGRRGLTTANAKAFGELLNVRPDYLLCKNDFKSQNEETLYNLNQNQIAGDKLDASLIFLLQVNGFTVKSNLPTSNNAIEWIQSLKNAYTISKEGRTLQMSFFDFRDFANEICDYVEMRMKHILTKKGE